MNMKKSAVIFGLFRLLSSALGAQQVIKANEEPLIIKELHVPKPFGGETVYTNARLTKVDPDGLHFFHDNGAVKVPYEKLPLDLQAKFGFDAAKAGAFRQEQSVAEKSFLEGVDKIKAEQKKQADDTKSAKQNAVASAAMPTPITINDVKAQWLIEYDIQRVPSLDRDLVSKRKLYPLMTQVILAGQLDSLADKFVCQYNMSVYSKLGDSEAVERERDRLISIRYTEAIDNLSDSIRSLANALNTSYQYRARYN